MIIFQAPFQPSELISHNLRIQVLSPYLVRIEEKGPEGFEDRPTFTVVSRPAKLQDLIGSAIHLDGYTVQVPEDSKAEDVIISDDRGQKVFQWDGKRIPHSFLPGPESRFRFYAISDEPRISPPAWGATPPPPNNEQHIGTSGWDLGNNAPDIYVFLRGPQGYQELRKDFLDLTGHTPMPPLAAFGFWDSRYYEYKQQEALDTIDKYRCEGFPLDFFVVDTDWRVNGSHGYEVNASDFPDMPKFISDAHAKHVELMYNDHPEPISREALSPEELGFRWKGLSKLLNWGADVWWYDRNWSTHLDEPAPGIAPEVWGDCLYHDMTLRAHPGRRPLMMSNVEGIDNGVRDYAPHPAQHRYPIWWTGDTSAKWSYLVRGVKNGVDCGVTSLMPYVNEDLGGHIGVPTPELYVRYLEYGSLSPITRVHCTKGEDRHPWAFGARAESIVRDYIKLRYRLLPTLYAAAHQAYENGEPLLRRCDLEWPQFPEAADDTQYLLGDDLLVAPTLEGIVPSPTIAPARLFHTPEGAPGLRAEYFANDSLSGNPSVTRTDATIDFDWHGSPAPGIPAENFSTRWSTRVGPMPATGVYQLAVRMDDGCRLYLNGKILIDDWKPNAEKTDSVEVSLVAGQTYDLRLDYLQLGGEDTCHLEWLPPVKKRKYATRTLWIPPGNWESVWTGTILAGPQKITVDSPLEQIAMFVRRGGVVLSVPDMKYTGEKPWDRIVVDAYAGAVGSNQERKLYEDDGQSNAYLNGGFKTTSIVSNRSENEASVRISPSASDYKPRASARAWVVRVHLWPGRRVRSVVLDGRPLDAGEYETIAPSKSSPGIPFAGENSPPPSEAGAIVQIAIPASPVDSPHLVTVDTKGPGGH